MASAYLTLVAEDGTETRVALAGVDGAVAVVSAASAAGGGAVAAAASAAGGAAATSSERSRSASPADVSLREDAAHHQITTENNVQWLRAVGQLTAGMDRAGMDMHGDTTGQLAYFDTTETNLDRLYELFDVDHGATITKEEVQEGMEKHMGFKPEQLRGKAATGDGSQKTAFDLLFELADRDQDQMIKRNEFAHFIKCLLQSMANKRLLDVKDGSTIQYCDAQGTRLGTIEYLVQCRAQGAEQLQQDEGEKVKINFRDSPWDCQHSDYCKGSGDAKSCQCEVCACKQCKWESQFWFSPPEPHYVRWVSALGEIGKRTALRLAVKYGLHPLAVEDLLQLSDQKPKVDKYETHYVMVIPVIRLTKECAEGIEAARKRSNDREQATDGDDPYPKVETEIANMAIVVIDEVAGRSDANFDTLITVHGWWKRMARTSSHVRPPSAKKLGKVGHGSHASLGHSRSLNSIEKYKPAEEWMSMSRPGIPEAPSRDHSRNEGGTSTFSEGSFLRSVTNERSRLRQGDVHRLLYEILDTAIDLLRPVTEAYSARIDAVHDALQKDEANFAKEHIKLVLAMKRDILGLLRQVRPLGTVIRHVMEDKRIIGEQALFLLDAKDHMDQAIEQLESFSVTCEMINDEYRDHRDSQMNDTLFLLTLITICIVPAQFLTGLFGMNFVDLQNNGSPAIPFLVWEHGYVAFWIISITTSVLLWLFVSRYRKRKGSPG